MLLRQETISKLIERKDLRASYIRAKLNQLIPSQIRALRINADMSQLELGFECDMKQSRISAAETPGGVNFSLETLIRLASALKVGLQVRFVPYSELLNWENNFSQDQFRVVPIENDQEFLHPAAQNDQGAIGLATGTDNAFAVQMDSRTVTNELRTIDSLVGANAAAGGDSLWMQ